MLFGTITLTDLFLGGDSQEAANAGDSVKMASLVFGGREFLDSHTVIRATINVLSPLRYAPEQSAALMILSGNNQLAVVTNMAMLGSTAPVDLSASLVLGNAEILAGIALSQLARPGAPVVYGSTSCPVDMRAMAATLGAPEALWLGRASVEMARYYGIPSRTGGGLTDSFLVDGQAAAEAALSLQNTLCCGADLVMHAFGMMGGYFASSLEKWVLDEEICSFVLDSLRPSEPTIDEAAIEEIIKLGPGANYLVRPSTVRKFRDVHSFRLFNKLPHDQWLKKSGVDLGRVCQEEVGLRLGQYEKPPMDEKLENELALYVKKRKEEIW
jgi:trimethylamine--corrinoid protein Co-methyltransferase